MPTLRLASAATGDSFEFGCCFACRGCLLRCGRFGVEGVHDTALGLVGGQVIQQNVSGDGLGHCTVLLERAGRVGWRRDRLRGLHVVEVIPIQSLMTILVLFFSSSRRH